MTNFFKQSDNLKELSTETDFNTDLTSTEGEGIWLEYGFTGFGLGHRFGNGWGTVLDELGNF
jgi:hypothetical protein